MKRKSVHQVQSPAAWGVLISPVRAEMAEALRLLGPCSLAEIGAAINRPADALYKHLELLQQAGFVVEAGFRKGARNVEQLFDVVADDFMIDFKDGTGAAENKAVVTTANSFLKALGRAVRDSAAARQLEFHPARRNIAISYELSWLTPEDFQEVRSLIARIKQLMDAGKQKREGRLYMSLFVATPVTRRRGAGERGQSSSRLAAGTAKKKKSKPLGK
jgi:hypothetical protein